MKRILCVIFAVVLCFAMSISSFAEEEYPRLVDVGEVLTDSEEIALLAKLDAVSEKHGCDVVIITDDTIDGADVGEYSNGLYEELCYGYGDTDDCLLLLLVMDTREWAVSKNGFAIKAFTDDGFEYIIDNISDDLGDDNFAVAFDEYADLCDDFLAQARAGKPYTLDTLPKEPFDEEYPRLVDVGEVLTDSEEIALQSKLDAVSEKYKCDVVIITADTIDGADVDEYSNVLYEELCYGYGDTDDCLLFLLVMDTRDWAVSKNGFALKAFTDDGFEYIINIISDDLGNDNFAVAFDEYADLCDDFLAKARAGKPYTLSTLPKEPFDVVVSLGISVIIGLIVAFIGTGIMKGKLKSVRFRSGASDYTRAGSMSVNEARDFFLYSTISRTAKQQNNDSGNGGGGGSSRNQSGKF